MNNGFDNPFCKQHTNIYFVILQGFRHLSGTAFISGPFYLDASLNEVSVLYRQMDGKVEVFGNSTDPNCIFLHGVKLVEIFFHHRLTQIFLCESVLIRGKTIDAL